MRKVLIPTDFSENAENAIQYALELFKYDRSEFLIVNAYADAVYENTLEMSRDFFDEYKEKVKEATDRQLQKTVATMLEISPNPRHNYEYLSVFQSLVDATNDLVEKENIDVVVMGTKGKTSDREITFGSQTLQVIKYVKCPVLAIPQRYHKNPPENILFPTDYLIPYKRRELKLLSTIISNFGAKINFFHLSNSKALSHRQIDNRTFLESCTLNSHPVFTNKPGDDLEAEINELLENENYNFLVMVNSRHSYMESLLVNSTIDNIGLKIEVPFLVLQNLPR